MFHSADHSVACPSPSFREPFSSDVCVARLPARARQHVDLAARYDVERVARIAGTRETLATVEMPVADTGQDSFDLFGRMAQQIAFRQQLDCLFRILLL